MSEFTENQLRTVLAERGGDGPKRPARLEEIAERGRRVRLRQRATAFAALAGAAAAIAALSGVVVPGFGKDTAATSVQVTTGVQLPETVEGSLDELSLIHVETHEFVGQRVEVTFRPTTAYTGRAIRCADPMAWVLVREGPPLLVREGPPRFSHVEFSRCDARQGSGLDSQHTEESVDAGWLAGPQTIEVWVFPADAPISDGPPGDPYANCKVADRKQGTCDGKFTQETLASKPERIAAAVGRRPGLWSVGIYDKLDGS
ncbi:hypothetical protein OG589_03250 [Sphaerisporangium sp. NBC_01403]|uniref:hypothetical protein n=1 Tax=Sphaerisporangium sp. NBC_01403 TaxID=2903599 RepID=UPI00324F1EBE